MDDVFKETFKHPVLKIDVLGDTLARYMGGTGAARNAIEANRNVKGVDPEQTFYHGSNTKNITEWDPMYNSAGHKQWRPNHPYLSFATDQNFAQRYAGEGDRGRVYPVKLDAKNVGDFRNPEHVKAVINYRNELRDKWLDEVQKERPDIWTPEKVEQYRKDEQEYAEKEIKHGSWQYWEDKRLWDKMGWDGAWNREQIGHVHANELNISVPRGDQVKNVKE